MTTLPTWMRGAMYATAVMNVLAAGLFLPGAEGLRALADLPPEAPPIYLATVSMFILLFGLGYFWCAVTGRADRLFVTLAAVGKLAFVTMLVCFWLAGELSARAVLGGVGDLVFGTLFVTWLLSADRAVEAGGRTRSVPVRAHAR